MVIPHRKVAKYFSRVFDGQQQNVADNAKDIGGEDKLETLLAAVTPEETLPSRTHGCKFRIAVGEEGDRDKDGRSPNIDWDGSALLMSKSYPIPCKTVGKNVINLYRRMSWQN